jgi:cytochrome P450
MTPVFEYDPLNTRTLADPYPVYAKLRESTPIFWHDKMQSWVLSRYQDCFSVLRDGELFARDRGRVAESTPEFQQNVQSIDPPDHSPLRSLFMKSFRGQDFTVIKNDARVQASAIFDKLASRSKFDVMTEVAAPFSHHVLSKFLGIEKSKLSSFAAISEAITRRMDSGLDPERATAGDQARLQLNELMDSWFATTHQPGLLTDVKKGWQVSSIPYHQVRNTIGVMYNAGYSTIYAATGNLVLTLLRHPDLTQQLHDSSLLETAVNELIRFDGPTQGTSRLATATTSIAGVKVERGQTVLTLLAAANRDPDQFQDPDSIVLSRKPNRHLGFGWGLHSCMGSMLADVTLGQLLAELVDQPTPLRMVGDPTHRRTATVRTLEHLPVTFLPRDISTQVTGT